MKKGLILAIGLCLVVVCVALLWQNSWASELSRRLGVDLFQGTLVEEEDTHGGFHGDGERRVVLSFAGGDLSPRLEKAAGWQPFPLPEELSTALYGRTWEGGREGPCIGFPMPPVTRGFFWFQDRHSQAADPADPSQLYERWSYNFTVAVYDEDTQRLYYIEVDT